MKHRMSTRLLASIVILLLAITSSTLFAYAYFENNEQYGFQVQTGDFEVTAYISFDGEFIDVNSPYYIFDEDIILINAYDSQSENYIGKLKIDLEITPNIASRVRVKVLDEWELIRTYINQNPEFPVDPIVKTIYHTRHSEVYHPFSLFLLGQDYNPIYDSNGYAYLTEVLTKNQTTVIHLIDGGDGYPTRSNEIFYETCQINLRFIVDVVQANRFSEIWSIDSNFFNS